MHRVYCTRFIHHDIACAWLRPVITRDGQLNSGTWRRGRGLYSTHRAWDDRDMCFLLVLLFPPRGRAAPSRPSQPAATTWGDLAKRWPSSRVPRKKKRVKALPFCCESNVYSCRQFTVRGSVVGVIAGPDNCVWLDPLFFVVLL